MKKFNLIIGKRQIIIVALLITLSVAAFLNWQFATGDQAITVTEDSTSEKKEEGSQNYGEAELVSKRTDNIKKQNNQNDYDYIESLNLSKERNYDDRIEEARSNSENGTSSGFETINKIQNKRELEKYAADRIKNEVSSVNNISVYFNPNKSDNKDNKLGEKNENIEDIDSNSKTVQVTVSTTNNERLTSDEISQMKGIINNTFGVPSEEIVITPSKIKMPN